MAGCNISRPPVDFCLAPLCSPTESRRPTPSTIQYINLYSSVCECNVVIGNVRDVYCAKQEPSLDKDWKYHAEANETNCG
jgi:hypothetical protein